MKAINSVLALIVMALVYGAYYNFSRIHIPVAPAAVPLPLGEQNRDTKFFLGKSAYTESLDYTIEAIPDTAWCDQVGWYSDRLSLSCTWPTYDENIKYKTAEVDVPLPDTDVWSWKFNRETLSAVAEEKGWLNTNFENFFAFLICTFFGLLSILGLLALFLPEKKSPSRPFATGSSS